MKKYYWLVGGYLALVFVAAEIHSFIFDLEPRVLWHEYEVDQEKEPTLTIAEWIERQDRASERFLDWVADGTASAFDPWYQENPSAGTHHNEGN